MEAPGAGVRKGSFRSLAHGLMDIFIAYEINAYEINVLCRLVMHRAYDMPTHVILLPDLITFQEALKGPFTSFTHANGDVLLLVE